jgi:Rieske Fe-S protein
MPKISRREFLHLLNRFLAATGLLAVAGPLVAFFYPPKLEETPTEPVLVGLLDDLPLGAGKVVPFGRYPALVIHTQEGLRCYSAVCTHFACICKWNPEIGRIACPCHDGYFDPLDGSVLAGPPPSALQSIPVRVVGEEIYLGGEA